MEIKLSHPFRTASGQNIETLTMRRAKVKDLKASQRFGENSQDYEFALLAMLTGLTPEDIQDMDVEDYAKLQDSFRRSLGDGGTVVVDAGNAGDVLRVSAE